jgi:hypothetical protein
VTGGHVEPFSGVTVRVRVTGPACEQAKVVTGAAGLPSFPDEADHE